MKLRVNLLIAICFLSQAGCLSHRVSTDGRNFRQALLDMYDDQVMGNLIRAANRQAFVQLDYRNLIVTDTQTIKANLSDESDPTNARTIAKATGIILTKTRGYTNKFFYGGGVEQDRQMQFQADPVTGKNDIYDYYRAFVQDPTLFCSSEKEPNFPVHNKKEYCGRWYWVPCQAGGLYLQLALKTTFMLGAETPPPIYWTTGTLALAPRYNMNGHLIPKKYVLYVNNPVPNDDGFALVTLAEGGTRRINISKLDTEPFSPGIELQESVRIADPRAFTTRLYVDSDQAFSDAVVESLTNRRAQIYAANMPNFGVKPIEQKLLEDRLAEYRKLQSSAH